MDPCLQYKILCKLDHQKTLVPDYVDYPKEKTRSTDKAMFIYKNIEKMDLIERQKTLFSLLSEQRITVDLMKYELRYLNTGLSINNFEEYIIFMIDTFRRYHMKAGGFICEDTEWTLYRHGSGKYPLKENEAIFENSIKMVHRYDFNIAKYIMDLINFFKRHKGPSLNISYRLLDTTDDIYWMIFKISSHNK